MKSIEKVFEKIRNQKVLVVFPHPDDESVMAGGVILKALQRGLQVTVLTLTEGNRGKIHVAGSGRSLAEIRREEMALAMSRLGVVDWVMWRFDDGKLRQTQKWRARLEKFIESTDPGLIITYDLSGVTGHPDHISLSREILRIWRGRKQTRLLWTSFQGWAKEKMVDANAKIYLQKPKYILALSLREAARKWRAVFAHRSQGLAGFLGSPWWLMMLVARTEWYSEAERGKKYRFRYFKFKI